MKFSNLKLLFSLLISLVVFSLLNAAVIACNPSSGGNCSDLIPVEECSQINSRDDCENSYEINVNRQCYWFEDACIKGNSCVGPCPEGVEIKDGDCHKYDGLLNVDDCKKHYKMVDGEAQWCEVQLNLTAEEKFQCVLSDDICEYDACAGKEPPVIEIKKPQSGSSFDGPIEISIEVTNMYEGDKYKGYGFFVYETVEGGIEAITIFSDVDVVNGLIEYIWDWGFENPYFFANNGRIVVYVTHSTNPLCHTVEGELTGINLGGQDNTDEEDNINPVVPEFTTVGVILGLLGIAIVYLLIVRRKNITRKS